LRKTVDILGIPVDSITMTEAVSRVASFIEEGGLHMIFTPNAEIIMIAQKDDDLKNILTQADMLTADGAGVVLASKLLKRRVPEKVSGVDMVREIFKACKEKSLRCYLLGSKPGVAQAAADNISREYPGVVIVGCHDGYFTEDMNDEIVNEINATNADLLLVALGAPKQEKWIYKNKDKLNARVCMGVGGTIDILAGTVALAPDFFRRNGLEWLYRLIKEPRRAVRMINLPKFMIRVLRAKLTGV